MSTQTPNVAPEPVDDLRADATKVNSGRAILFLGILALLVFAVYVYGQLRKNPSEAENVKLQQELANLQETVRQLKTAEVYRTEEVQLAKSRLQAAALTGKTIQESIASLDDEVKKWTTRTSDLLTNDQGRSLAADPKALEQFRAIYKQERPPATVAAELRSLLDIVLVPIDTALKDKNTAYNPNPAVIDQLNAIREKASAALTIYRTLNGQLDAIVSSVSTKASPSSPTMRAAINDLDRAWAAEDAELVAAKLNQARKESATKLAEVKAKAELEIAQAKIDAEKKIAEAKIEAAKVEAEVAARKLSTDAATLKRLADEQIEKETLALQRAELRKEALTSDVLQTLAPFITPGYVQPGRESGGDIMYGKAIEKKPVSLAVLKSMGALEPTDRGLRLLGLVGSQRFQAGGGPVWSEGTYGVNHELLVKARGYLEKYGDILAEEGKLRP